MEKSCSEALPPCRVCRAPATGLHYGVISCEACKAFYRRSLARGDVYECPEKRDCDISSESRNNCAYCRYQKCIKTGMSKDAIKTGRYSYAMKASTIREVKGLKSDAAKDSKSNSQNCLETSSHLQSSYPCNTVPTSGNVAVIDNRKTENIIFDMQNIPESHAIFDISNIVEPNATFEVQNIAELHMMKMQPFSEFGKQFFYGHDINDISTDYTSTGSDSQSSCIEELLLSTLKFSDQESEDCICNHSTNTFSNSTGQCRQFNSHRISSFYNMRENKSDLIDVSEKDLDGCNPYNGTADCVQLRNKNKSTVAAIRCRESEQKLYDFSKIEIYDRVIEQMYDKHKAIVADEMNIGESLSTAELEYLEMIELKKKIFGQLEPMSTEEYFNFYEETGLDIDGRREMLLEFIPVIEHSVQLHIEFAKTIPGFRDLSLKDQVGLIKGSRMEFFMIGSHRCFNTEHKLYTPFVGKVYHMDDMKKLEGEHSEPTFVMQQRIKKLNLSREETVVLSAFCIMATDYCDLEDPKRVEYSQDFLLECLFYLFDKHHPGVQQRFIRIVECLTEMRNVREVNIKCDEKLFNMWRNIINFPPLLCEFIS